MNSFLLIPEFPSLHLNLRSPLWMFFNLYFMLEKIVNLSLNKGIGDIYSLTDNTYCVQLRIVINNELNQNLFFPSGESSLPARKANRRY